MFFFISRQIKNIFIIIHCMCHEQRARNQRKQTKTIIMRIVIISIIIKMVLKLNGDGQNRCQTYFHIYFVVLRGNKGHHVQKCHENQQKHAYKFIVISMQHYVRMCHCILVQTKQKKERKRKSTNNL